ncbi:type II and III secretion system protein family protein [Pseudodesulfovibrio tunisiensis]|uniref:type II and III secretion system protein family protein n=1 Tax=Pseudodesulfovibrio tunisiensis TaxID=463192 RepID=UPI001FB498A8|nr:type II and III secretion system protein family protein [Pseudodesulfovibrio tunisiensis]
MNGMKMMIICLLLLRVLATAGIAGAGDVNTETPDVIRLVAGKSTVLNTESRVTRVTLASEDLAHLVVLSPRQIYLAGKKMGSTTLTLWNGSTVANVYDVIVTPDVTRLKRLIHEILPNERNVQVLSSGASITLSGAVSSTANLGTVLSLAEAEAPGKVANLLKVDGVHQVLLEVRVAEMSRVVTRRMGINFAYIGSNFGVYSFLNNLTSIASSTETTIGLTKNINAVGAYASGSTQVMGFIDALKANGLVRILAEPNLSCISGETAEFLVGGEVPIPKPGMMGQVGIDYKPFGVGLKFTPTVLGSGRINLQVGPEVSELDSSKGIEFSGYKIPAISTRRANTVIEMGDGQSFAIAGLISESTKNDVHRFPVLGDVPVLGTLFKSNEFQNNKTELVIIVTAHLAKPVDLAKQVYPTDGYKEPSDYEFYMLGLLEGRRESGGEGRSGKTVRQSGAEPVVRPESGFDGEFGHAWPK